MEELAVTMKRRERHKWRCIRDSDEKARTDEVQCGNGLNTGGTGEVQIRTGTEQTKCKFVRGGP